MKTTQAIIFLAMSIMSIDDLTHLNFRFSEHTPYAYPAQQENNICPTLMAKSNLNHRLPKQSLPIAQVINRSSTCVFACFHQRKRLDGRPSVSLENLRHHLPHVIVFSRHQLANEGYLPRIQVEWANGSVPCISWSLNSYLQMVPSETPKKSGTYSHQACSPTNDVASGSFGRY